MHLLGRLGILQRDVDDRDARIVAVDNLLHQLLGVLGDLLLAFIEHEVHFRFADDFTHRGLGRLQHHLAGVAVVEQPGLGIFQAKLHRKLDVDDVLVVGQHQGFLEHLGLDVVAVADFDLPQGLHVDDLVALDRIRQAPLEAGAIGQGLEFAKTQNRCRLAFRHDEKPA